MMIECPRCGFSQPKDQYCASCGVDMDQLLAKPKPLFVRLVQNPNFHLALIGCLIAIVVAWIIYTQSGLVSREMSRILDRPLSSRDAADPEERVSQQADMMAGDVNPDFEEEEKDPENETALNQNEIEETTSPVASAGEVQRLELSYWEVPREPLLTLLSGSQKLGESSSGRSFYVPQSTKLNDLLQTTGQPLASPKSANLAANAQITTDTAANAPEMFQFAFVIQISKMEAKEASVRWIMNMALPQSEPPDAAPAMRQVLESNFTGTGTLVANGAIVLILEPANRSPRDEYVVRAGEGPWAIFASPEFRAGVTEFVAVLQLK